MRRKGMPNTRARNQALVYAVTILTLLVYAVPRLPALQHGLAGTFAFAWIVFASLALAADLYFFFGADKERSRMLEEIEVVEVQPEMPAPEPAIRKAH